MTTSSIIRQRPQGQYEAPTAEPIPARKMGDVENEVGRIQAVLQVGHENLSRLIAQLDPILSQPLPADNEKSVPAQTTCQLGEALRQMGNLAQELARRITEVSERVCL